MQRFILSQNIARYRKLLVQESEEATRRTIAVMLVRDERELARIEATLAGVVASERRLRGGDLSEAMRSYLDHFRETHAQSGKLYLLLDPRPGLPIVDASDAYATATMTKRSEMPGCHLFDVFPDNPLEPAADGVAHLYASLRTAAETGRAHEMPIQRYDVRDPAGKFVERYWCPVNTPVLDDDGNLIALLHHVEDVTEQHSSGSPAKSIKVGLAKQED